MNFRDLKEDLRELFCGIDPMIADPTMKNLIIEVKNLKKKNIELQKFVRENIFNNPSIFKNIPPIRKNKSKIYLFSLRHPPQKAHLDMEYSIRNLSPVNPAILLYYFFENKDKIENHLSFMTIFRSKMSSVYSVLICKEKPVINMFSSNLDPNKRFEGIYYFCGVKKRSLFERIYDFFNYFFSLI